MIGNAVVTNKCPVIPNRGIGKPGMCYIWERMMDRVAQELNLSPIEVRRENLIQPNEMPYRTISGNVYDSGDYPGLLSTLLEKIDYDKLREEQKQARAEGRLMGIGIVIGVEPGGATRARDMAIFPEMKEPPGSGGVNGAKIKLEKNGTLSLHLGSPNCGQAHETTTAQVAAEILGSTPDKISTSIPFDSDLSAWGVAAAQQRQQFSSLRHWRDPRCRHPTARKDSQARGVQSQSGAVRVNHRRQRRKDPRDSSETDHLRRNLAASPTTINISSPMTWNRDWRRRSTTCFLMPKPNIVPGADRMVRAQFTFSAGAHAAIVEVDKNTGAVHVIRYLIVGDNGVVINPDVVNGQVYGSAAHGIAVALGEGFMYSAEGQPLTITYLDYGKCSTARDAAGRSDPPPVAVAL